MLNTDRAGDCLVRLPLWVGMDVAAVDAVIAAIRALWVSGRRRLGTTVSGGGADV